MSNLVILNLQYLMAIGTLVIIYRIYLRQWFRSRPMHTAVLPLLLLHAFRYLGLTLIVPGQMDQDLSPDGLSIMAWGDYASGAAALLAAIAVHHRWPIATAMVALFTVIGIGDFIVVGYTATTIGVFFADMGTMWYVLVVFAPALLLSQIYIAYRLVMHLFSGSRMQPTS
jgi:hypothetical protein